MMQKEQFQYKENPYFSFINAFLCNYVCKRAQMGEKKKRKALCFPQGDKMKYYRTAAGAV
jgi:hypothetical protein